ncbi:MAG: NAD(P)H-dependent oxidoreductase subunit E [Thermodesulfobacteriota bacterium]
MNCNLSICSGDCGSPVPVISPDDLDRLDSIVDRFSRRGRYLIPALKEAQEMFGYLPRQVLERLAKGFDIPASRVHGVVTFYSYFTTAPRGRHTVRLCLGTACYVKGSSEILDHIIHGDGLGLKVGSTSRDGRFTLCAVRCLGACGLAPVMVVDDDVHGNLTPGAALTHLTGYP